MGWDHKKITGPVLSVLDRSWSGSLHLFSGQAHEMLISINDNKKKIQCKYETYGALEPYKGLNKQKI